MDNSILEEKHQLLVSDFTPEYKQLYFHPAEGPASHMLTRITPEHHNSVNMADFDNAILNLLG